MIVSTLTLMDNVCACPDKQNLDEGGDLTYPLTLHDLEQYLDSKRDDEVIGITWNGTRCLVAEALHAHCGLHASVGQTKTWFPALDGPGGLFVETPEEIVAIVIAFDCLAASSPVPFAERAITKREWRRWHSPSSHRDLVP